MKHWIITAAVGVAAFIGGCFAGWEAKKRTEITFEEVTEAELETYAKEDMKKQQEKAPETIKPEEHKPAYEDINTAKIDYAAKWSDEAGKYRTRGELPEGEDPVITEEDVENLDLDEDLVIDDLDSKLPAVEESDEDEFERWVAEPDGEYQAMEVTWFAGDNVLVDEDNDPITNHQRYLGFDPKKEFEKLGVKKDEAAVIYRKNNLLQIIFQVTRYPASYGKRKFKEEFGEDDNG